jgi:hypothetical protein
MAKVKIKITGKATTDTQPRYLGLVFDGTLGGFGWAEAHPEYKVKDPVTGADLVISIEGFTFEQEYDLTAGAHTLETAPSSPTGYNWDVEVFINDVSQGKKSGINSDAPYTASFTVTATLAETMAPMLSMMVSLIMLVMMISMLTSMMKAFKPGVA